MEDPTILETAALAWAEIDRIRALVRDGFEMTPLIRRRRDRIVARLRAAVDDAWIEAETLREEIEEIAKERANG
jgi:hypothetical protein